MSILCQEIISLVYLSFQFTYRSNLLWYSGFFINSIHKWPNIYLQMYYTSRSSSGCDENEEIGVCANISKRF